MKDFLVAFGLSVVVGLIVYALVLFMMFVLPALLVGVIK